MAESMVQVQVDRVSTREEAEAKWRQRSREPGVIACCFLLMEEEKVLPKTVLPEVWHVHTVYHT